MIDTSLFRTPGQLIQSLLDERGWTKRVLAVVLNVDETGINKMVAGKRSVDAETALALGSIFGIPAEKFLELQKSYDLAQARLLLIEDPSIAVRAQMFANFPISDMIKRGWLEANDIKNFPKVESALAKFFGVSTVQEIEIFPLAAKRTNVIESVSPPQLAWFYRVREIASEMLTARFHRDAVLEAIALLKPLLRDRDMVRKVPRILQDCGIRFVIVEPLPGSKIDGVTFWIDERKPVIALSLRFDRLDNFWFVLRHELEHVLCNHGLAKNIIMMDAELDGESETLGKQIIEEEKIANLAAAEFCVPQKSLSDFIARKSPFFADRDIIGFASILKVHPAIVAGQLRMRLKRYDRFHAHLTKVRSAIVPSALVDGWGNFVPVKND